MTLNTNAFLLSSTDNTYIKEHFRFHQLKKNNFRTVSIPFMNALLVD